MSNVACVIGWTVKPEITVEELCTQYREFADKLESGQLVLNEVVSIAAVSLEDNIATLTPVENIKETKEIELTGFEEETHYLKMMFRDAGKPELAEDLPPESVAKDKHQLEVALDKVEDLIVFLNLMALFEPRNDEVYLFGWLKRVLREAHASKRSLQHAIALKLH